MESAKEKAIREAYGEHWDKWKHKIDENGWYNNSDDVGYLSFGDCNRTPLEECEYFEDLFLRPKSLQGIENNNGWVETMVLGGIPLESGRYWVVKNGKIDLGYYNPEYNKWMCSGQYYYDTQQNLRITHFQKCTDPNLPIY